MNIKGVENKHAAKVDNEGVLHIGLDGFTIEDLARYFPNVKVGLHVKDDGKWIPVTIEQLTNRV